jgi:protein involved in polysaccharide export with SLBB domain
MPRLIFFALLLTVSCSRAFGQVDGAHPIPEVTLLPGDVIRVQIWREEDLSGDFLVSDGGVVTLPLLGPHTVMGVGMREFTDELIAAYREQLRNPSITIVPLRRISVLGEVNRPGLYLADPTITLAAAIGLADGVTREGTINRVRIVRNGQVVYKGGGASQALNAIDVRSGDQIFVDPRPWLSRNATYAFSTALSIGTLILTLFLR